MPEPIISSKIGLLKKGETNLLELNNRVIERIRSEKDFKDFLSDLENLKLDAPTEFMLGNPTEIINPHKKRRKAAEVILLGIESWEKAKDIKTAAVECFDVLAIPFATHVAHLLSKRGAECSIFLRPTGRMFKAAYPKVSKSQFEKFEEYPNYTRVVSNLDLMMQLQTFNKGLEGEESKKSDAERKLRSKGLIANGNRAERKNNKSMIVVCGYTSFHEVLESGKSIDHVEGTYLDMIGDTPVKAKKHMGVIKELEKELNEIKGSDEYMYLHGKNPKDRSETSLKVKVNPPIEVMYGLIPATAEDNLVNIPDGELFFLHIKDAEGTFYVDHYLMQEGKKIIGMFTYDNKKRFSFQGENADVVEKYLTGSLSEQYGSEFHEVGVGWMPKMPDFIKTMVTREKECGVHIGIGNEKTGRHIDFATSIDRIEVRDFKMVREDYTWKKA